MDLVLESELIRNQQTTHHDQDERSEIQSGTDARLLPNNRQHR